MLVVELAGRGRGGRVVFCPAMTSPEAVGLSQGRAPRCADVGDSRCVGWGARETAREGG